MTVLGDRIRVYLDTRRLSAREFSLAAELNPDEVARILENPRRIPRLETLRKLSLVTGWRFEEMVYWALGEEAPRAPDGEPERVIAGQLTRMGFSETRRQLILGWLRELAPGGQAEPEGRRKAHTNSA